jgi:hypothetical protein
MGGSRVVLSRRRCRSWRLSFEVVVEERVVWGCTQVYLSLLACPSFWALSAHVSVLMATKA